MVERRNFKENPLTTEEVLRRRWYAVVNDLIGGWDISTVDKPASQLDPWAGEYEVGTFMDKAVAQHIVEIHNTWWDIEVWKTYTGNIYTTHANELASKVTGVGSKIRELLDKNINKH